MKNGGSSPSTIKRVDRKLKLKLKVKLKSGSDRWFIRL